MFVNGLLTVFHNMFTDNTMAVSDWKRAVAVLALTKVNRFEHAFKYDGKALYKSNTNQHITIIIIDVNKINCCYCLGLGFYFETGGGR